MYKRQCPEDVKKALEEKPTDEKLTVNINSGGGSVQAGQEIYSMLHNRTDVEIKIQSMAYSAASVIAMANKCEISPVAMIMIHNVSMNGAAGDYHDMQKNAEILRQMNAALASAYTAKTGKSQGEILKLMDEETWITAQQALDMGFVDGIIKQPVTYTNSFLGQHLTDEMKAQALKHKPELGGTEEWCIKNNININEPIRDSFGRIVIDNSNEIRAYREIFGNSEDKRFIRAFQEYKQYAKDTGKTKIEAVNELELAKWRSKHMTNLRPYIDPDDMQEQQLLKKADNQLREAFKLPKKER